jgi:hypothetical protein
MLGKNNIARIFAIILINLPPNVNARTITVTLTVESIKMMSILHDIFPFYYKICSGTKE